MHILIGNAHPHREWESASPGMGERLTGNAHRYGGMHIITGNAQSLYKVVQETSHVTVQDQWAYRAFTMGLYVDENLKWEHVHHVIRKVLSGIAILKSSRNYLPHRTLIYCIGH